MKTITKSITILLLCLFCKVSLQADEIPCDRSGPSELDACLDDEFTPTCGYYTENCPLEVCGLPAANPCYACQDPNVLYYKAADCKPEELVSQCFDDICQFTPEQEKFYEPVCGLQNNAQVEGNSKTFTNECQACGTNNYSWYQSGVCEGDRKYCDDSNRPSDCTEEENSPVCASLKIEADWSVFTTAANACNACKDPNVTYYTEGECGLFRDNTTYCLPNNRPGACTKEYNPVCGFYKGEDGSYEHKELSNPCMACADSDIIYHIPGPCEFTCNRNPNIIFECIGSTVDPICGTYEENGETKKVSLKNSCIGCYNVPIQITSYVDGLCPGDVGIRCENDASGFLQGLISPVCGVFQEGCEDDSCRQTFSEPLFACNDPSTVLYIPGACPGDEGISCEPFRSNGEGNEENNLDWSYISYPDVCGYSEAGCEDESCRQTYTNQNEACQNESVLFFTEGPCQGEINEEAGGSEESL